MSTTTMSRTRRIFGRATEIWFELDYAQRRLMEMRTGVPQHPRRGHPAISASIGELEALYALGERECARMETDEH